MERDTDRYRSLTRRTAMLGAGQLALFGTLVGRMYYLQVTERERFAMLAEDNRVNLRLIAPTRGLILDRFGEPLAVNDQNFRVVLVAETAGDVGATLAKLSDIVLLTEADLARVMRDVGRRRPFVPVTVRENLTWEQVSRIEVNTPELPGLSIEVGDLRHYPQGPATAHFIGYVGGVSESELTGDPVLSLPGFRIGKNGVERQHEDVLRGVAGRSQVEVNAYGRVIRELNRDQGTAGHDLRLTVDVGLQTFAQARLSANESAAAVVMDVNDGGILALASSPSFDPNLFTRGIPQRVWQELTADPYAPLTNKCIAGQYAPGSTFKMIVALAALESGAVTAEHTVHCGGHMSLGNYRFHCWKRGGHGRIGMVAALEQSCDVFFYDTARRAGVDTIAAMAEKFGLGRKVGIDLPGERPGLIPTRGWKQATLGQPWQQGETLVTGIGQGFVLTTPLQLATMVARMVNGGRAVQPHLAMRVGEEDPRTLLPEPTPVAVARQSLDVVVEGMIRVMTGSAGTARRSQIDVPGMEMGGKTGTSQVRRITAAERATGVRTNDQLPWRERDHALFVGFAPIQAPRYACAVIVEHGGGGSAVAAPICRDILKACQQRDSGRLPPGFPPVGEVAAADAALPVSPAPAGGG
jgi:penicillin-binding protein 2